MSPNSYTIGCHERLLPAEACVQVRQRGTRPRHRPSEIAYFYSDEKVTFLVTKEGQHLPIDFSLDRLTALLDPKHFFRTSRQFLVSFGAIHTVHTHFKGKLKIDLAPKSKMEVFVSGDRMTDFKEWLGK